MFLFLSKLLPLFVLPVGLTLSLLLLALLARLLGWARLSMTAAVAAIALLWISSTPVIASRLVSTLESRYPMITVDSAPALDCAVVLGGMLRETPRGVSFNEAVERATQAALLYRAGKAKTLIVAAGNIDFLQEGRPEAELLVEFLGLLGVGRIAILVDDSSRNTHENAVNSRPLVAQAGCAGTYLVTSAFHMPRAMAVFGKAGLEVTPFPVDFSSGDAPAEVFNWFPDAGALRQTTVAMREYIGMLVYRLRGWV